MAAENTAAMLKRLGIESDAATRLIQVGWSNLRTEAESTGDQFTRTIQAFGLAPEQANQFATAVGRMGASAAVAHVPFSELLALAGEANRLLGGGRGATMFASMIQGLETAAAKGKATIDFSHGLVAALAELKSQLSGTPTEKLAELASMGLGAQGPQLLKLLDNLDEVTAKHKQIGESSGALAKAYGTATANMADTTQRLHQNWANLADTLSAPALGIQARATNALSDAVGGLSRNIEHHSVIAGAATIAVTGLGAAAYHGVQALSAMGTMSVFAGQGFNAIKYAAKALDFESWALRGMYFIDAIRAAEIGTKLWTAAQWLLDAALNANPIGAVITGVALLAAAAYEIYKHWEPISAFFEKLWSKIKSIFGEPVDWLKTTGLNMMKSLGEGILSGIEYPFKAAWDVAKKVGGLFQFHSPPVEGPLREAVLNFRFGEEVRKHIKQAPVIAASMGMAAGIAAAPVRGASGGGSIVVNYSPTINMRGASGSASDWVKAMRQHADELMRIVREKTFREQRLRFD